MGGGRITKVLEAVSLMLSIEGAPVISFLAIDPRIVIQSVEQSFGDVIQRKPARGPTRVRLELVAGARTSRDGSFSKRLCSFL